MSTKCNFDVLLPVFNRKSLDIFLVDVPLSWLVERTVLRMPVELLLNCVYPLKIQIPLGNVILATVFHALFETDTPSGEIDNTVFIGVADTYPVGSVDIDVSSHSTVRSVLLHGLWKSRISTESDALFFPMYKFQIAVAEL
jgi:hypothetical protein